jgi:hypothetical protein
MGSRRGRLLALLLLGRASKARHRCEGHRSRTSRRRTRRRPGTAQAGLGRVREPSGRRDAIARSEVRQASVELAVRRRMCDMTSEEYKKDSVGVRAQQQQKHGRALVAHRQALRVAFMPDSVLERTVELFRRQVLGADWRNDITCELHPLQPL